jgi:hypothetical protein
LKRAWGFVSKAGGIDETMTILENTHLLDIRCYRRHFPDANIEIERFMLLPKSMIAAR